MILAGSVLDRFPGQKYASSLRFFEFAPKAPWPRGATFTRMGHQLPDGVRVALRASRDAIVGGAGPLRVDDGLREARDRVIEAAENLGAAAIVLPTPADLTPGARSAELLARYVQAFTTSPDRHIVWAPAGAWEPEQASALAAAHGLVCAYDPLHGPRPEGKVVYAQLRAVGYQHGFASATLEEVVEQLLDPPCDDAFVSIESPRSFQQAQMLQGLVDASRPN